MRNRAAIAALLAACSPFSGSTSEPGKEDAAPATSGDAQASSQDSGTVEPVEPIDAGTLTAESCRDVLAKNSSLAGINGKYAVTPPGATAPIFVWCDMTTSGGGFTLAGRSVLVPSPVPFGWTSANGSIDDDTKPYSLDLVTNAIPFTEILLGQVGSSKAWEGNAFLVTVSATFLTDDADAGTSIAKPDAMEVGTCKPVQGRGWMFNYAGYTHRTSQHAFWFRDQNVFTANGLGYSGFNLANPCCSGDACDRSADLQAHQGMILVR